MAAMVVVVVVDVEVVTVGKNGVVTCAGAVVTGVVVGATVVEDGAGLVVEVWGCVVLERGKRVVVAPALVFATADGVPVTRPPDRLPTVNASKVPAPANLTAVRHRRRVTKTVCQARAGPPRHRETAGDLEEANLIVSTGHTSGLRPGLESLGKPRKHRLAG